MKKIIMMFIILTSAISLKAQNSEEFKYRRSSLYSIMVSHNEEKFAKEIEEEFLNIPIPDKFDNHDLSIKVITSGEKTAKQVEVQEFLNKNKVATRLVGKWFERDPKTGECSMELVAQRGLFGASYEDIQNVKGTFKGLRALEDAGEELIGNTFVVVNDIHYFDKNKGAQVGAASLKIAGAIASIFLGSSVSQLANQLGDLIASIKGFSVTVTSYLYQLEWTPEIATEFYTTQYIDLGKSDTKKKEAFDVSSNYRLRYVGSSTVKADDVTMAGVDDNDLAKMIRKVCTRAIDKSIVVLQKKYDEFKTKTAVDEVNGEYVTAHIGMKEGVAAKCLYEIVMPKVDEKGKITYSRVGLVEPVNGKICDNRYMASFEKTAESQYTSTTFKKVSGGEFSKGMLMREVRVK